jgi:hypothetical protein
MQSMSVCAAVLAMLAVPAISVAQSATTSSEEKQSPGVVSSQPSPTMESLARAIEVQQRLIEEQSRRIEALSRELAALRAGAAPSPAAGPVDVPPQTPVPVASEAGGDQGRGPELPPDLIPADFPGSISLPGSDAALRIGGLVRVNWVSTYDPLLVDDRFQTSAIPVSAVTGAEGGGRVRVIASPSRFNFDLRTPTGVGHIRAFIEADFAGDRSTVRLRHAYGQWRRAIFGQTWSTFSDPEAEPDGIDFEGLNAIVLFRQAQARWSIPLGERLRVALALEDPQPDLTGATGVNQVPDFVARVRWQPRVGGHVQVAAIARQLRGQPTDDSEDIVAAGAYGINVSGRLPFPFWHKRDQLLFQGNGGRGIGRYISDLRSLGGQDGVFDPEAQALRPLDVYSGYVGYEHWWAEQFRSSISFGIVGVTNPDFQPDDALRRTRRSSINFMWSPIPRLDLVTEFLWGTRTNKDGQRGFAAQTQIGSTFRF